uniref:Carbonic anhydrase n=1 Tax=Romanomermis culicivorax TaxID=13658 RepID=A0A915L115_ROMCU
MSTGNGERAIRKVLTGVMEYRKIIRERMLQQLKTIKNNPRPKAVFFTCMDSRMMATRFVQAQAGDMFMVRNAGNLIPRANTYGQYGAEVSISTEPAAIELGCVRGGIRHVIVCGHSDCKAMNTLHDLHINLTKVDSNSPLELWLRRNGVLSLEKLEKRMKNPGEPLVFMRELPDYQFRAFIDTKSEWDVKDRLSQINCLQQLENISTHSIIKEHIEKDLLVLNAMWFDVYQGDVYFFSKKQEKFVIIDETTINELLNEV